MPRGRGRGRLRARKPAAPVQTYVSEEELTEAPTAPQSPQEDNEDRHNEDPEDEEEPVAAPEEDDSDPEEPDANSAESSPPPIEVIPRKRRLGRPPKIKTPGWDTPAKDDDRDVNAGTPLRRRGRGRGGWRGRGRGRKSMVDIEPMIQQVKVDKEGTLADVIDDEVSLPPDPEGETKVDKNGNLLGGREYRVRTFTISGRQDRLYMLSTEPARCCGFRDSYLFFTKHLHLHKVVIQEEEKHDLIAREIIPHSYKGRSIGVCTARSVFREFGSRIVVGGRRVLDDYYAQAARDRGETEGELADPDDRVPAEGETYNRNQYVAWFGASQVYHQPQGGPVTVNGKPMPGKRKVAINSANWQAEHARAASRFNSFILESRKAVTDGVYDPHTNHVMFPRYTQPSHASWGPVDQSDATSGAINVISDGVGPHNTLANGLTNGDTYSSDLFPPVPTKVARNFLIADVHYKSAPLAGFGIPGADGDALTIGPNGLPDTDDDILAELPAECRLALVEAKSREVEWKRGWRTEAEDGGRLPLQIRFMGYPA